MFVQIQNIFNLDCDVNKQYQWLIYFLYNPGGSRNGFRLGLSWPRIFSTQINTWALIFGQNNYCEKEGRDWTLVSQLI